MTIVRLGSLLSIATVLSACQLTQSPTDKNTEDKNVTIKYLTVLHTNDNHGRFWHNEKGEYGMAARKTLIDSLRAQAKNKGHQVILLSGGDINTGIPESDLQYAEPDFKGMSLIGYDAMALGNHEFDNPLTVLDKQIAWSNFPLLSANIVDKKTNKPIYQPYEILEKGDIKIAIIGLTTVDTAKIANPEYIGHFDFIDPAPATQGLAETISKKYSPDITIAVTHMGHYVDGKHGINAPGDVKLARDLKYGTVDLIVGGHSQEPVCMEGENVSDKSFAPGDDCVPDKQNGTWIVQAHEWGKYVGKAEFKIDGGEVELTNYQLLPVNLKHNGKFAGTYIEADKTLYNFLKPYQDKGQKQIAMPIGKLKGHLEGDRNIVRFKPSNLGKLIAKAQKESVGGDFGLISGGGIRNSISEGEVSYKDVLKVHPFKNRITYVEMNGEELLKYLTTVLNFPEDSGAYCQYEGISFDLKNGQLHNLKIAGLPFDKNKAYRFSLNSYNAAGGDGYPNLTKHKKFVATDTIDAEILKRYFESKDEINADDYLP